MVGAAEGLQREDMEESRLGLDMVDERPFTVEHRLHVYIASHHTRVLSRPCLRAGLLLYNFSLTYSKAV